MRMLFSLSTTSRRIIWQEQENSRKPESNNFYGIPQSIFVGRGTYHLSCGNKSTCTARSLGSTSAFQLTAKYRPDFVVTLMRTPHLPPKYASFWVPLWFNKLDFKSYLKNVYNVDVLHIRSYVQQQKVQQRETVGSTTTTLGKVYRPASRKKMTVELVDPFVFPEEVKDLSP